MIGCTRHSSERLGLWRISRAEEVEKDWLIASVSVT